ncbi:Uncharacterised protein [uncultured archaeon]|nr:Uncharacterised protein [uncultured archaeon]
MSDEILEEAKRLGVGVAGNQAAPAAAPTPAPVQAPVQKPKIDITTLSPIERSIYLDAGENGVLLFRMADGRITLAEAMQRLGLNDAEMDGLLAKLSGKYLFTVAEQEAKKEEIKLEKTVKETIPIDVPKRTSTDGMSSLAVGSEITIRFGPSGKKILDSIDGKLDVVQLAADTMVTLQYVDDLMWFLSERHVVTFNRLRVEDIKKKYGGVGMSLYNENGRDGIYLYLLLVKTSDPRAAIRTSDIDPSKAVDMMELVLKQINAPISFNKRDALTMLKR